MLGPKLKDLAHELHSGRGFFVLRTLPIDDYSRADIVIVYAGKPSRFPRMNECTHNVHRNIFLHCAISGTARLNWRRGIAYQGP